MEKEGDGEREGGMKKREGGQREGGREGGERIERERCRERKREIYPGRDATSLKIAATDGHDVALAAQSRLVRLTSS
jgi:hypothetical protein